MVLPLERLSFYGINILSLSPKFAILSLHSTYLPSQISKLNEMRNGSYIRALGRQSFEPSQGPSNSESDSPNHSSSTSEQSQEMQRRLIKAQNDVLATVGVCLRDTKQSQDISEAIMQENEVGLLVGAVDMTVTYLASWPLIGIRNRLQVGNSHRSLTD